MFTGIIEQTGKIREIKKTGGGIELTIYSDLGKELEVDDSICMNGVCQTVISRDEQSFTVQAVEETLRKTTFGLLKTGDTINLERSLTLDKRLDGHIVQGHVDTTGQIVSIVNEDMNWLITIRYPESYKNLIVGRGSIAIDGISLTVAREEGVNEFTVAIIPYTFEHTNVNTNKVGDEVNLEFDILGKYVQKMMKKDL